MSKGNMLLGMARGKVGDLVFTRRNGEQITRPRVRVVNNPKTEGQQIQRMIFASCIWAYQKLKSVCDHSFEGVKYGADSQAKFMSENLKALRAYYPTSADPTAYAELNPAEMKSFALPTKEGEIGTGLIVALGTIPEVKPILTDGVVSGWGNTYGRAGQTVTVNDVLGALGAQKGDQISLIVIEDNGILSKSRYVIRADASEEELNAAWDPEGTASVFDADKTSVTWLLEKTDTHLYVDTAGMVSSMCIVISRKGDGDKWLRSNARMWYCGDEAPQYQADYALPYWRFTGTDIATTDPHYLNNADI
jgi:hypothetical protein